MPFLRYIIYDRPFGVADSQFSTVSTLCLKKVSNFQLSVTMSNVNRFSKFCIGHFFERQCILGISVVPMGIGMGRNENSIFPFPAHR